MNQFLLSHSKWAATVAALMLSLPLQAAEDWWNKDWTQRQKMTLDTSSLSESIGEATVLVRLHEGNFQFANAREDGSDLRFLAADGKTVLSHQIEQYDSLLNEAFVWVNIPDAKPASKETFSIYYGNQDPAMAPAGKATDAYGEDFAAVFHFGESGSAPADSTTNSNNATGTVTSADGSIIGRGIRLLGNNPLTIPNSPSLAWSAGQSFTIGAWVKPSALQANAVIVSRTEGENSFSLLMDQGVPIAEIKNGTATERSQPGPPIPVGTWAHLAFTSSDGKLQISVNGEPFATVAGTIPALNSPLVVGGIAGDAQAATGFVGEVDELSISGNAFSQGFLRFIAMNQGTTDNAQRLLSIGEVEATEAGGGHMMEHVMLFGDIANNMMFDGWIAIGVCVLMIIVGWTVAIKKFFYLNKIEKGNKEFLRQWKTLSTDITALDHSAGADFKSMGGNVEEEEQELMKDSPLYHIYHIGSEEISHRLDKLDDKVEGLPGRSIQAIRASLDTGMVHENHRLTDGLVFLTISIAGGPYVGLLGTVVGVMITFAIIAKSGEVNVNSIAPGIASALLATVVGLIVAIPALFIYSYLNGRIKNVVSTMQVFIDEFVAKMAEFYRPKNDSEPS